MLAEVVRLDETDAHSVVLDDTFLHVAGDCDERGDPGRRAGFEQLSHSAERDGEHTGKCIVGLGDEDDCRARRTAYKSRCVHDCDDRLLSSDRPWLVAAVEALTGWARRD
ncbi:MAG: hypothetical protein M0T79_06810 [Actinomycetota bacterium]|nr:hypothetical protein [Actinomycetota bacterium]